MPDTIERALAAALSDPCRIGEILIRKDKSDGFVLCHRDDEGRDKLQHFQKAEDAIEMAKFDDAGRYRPLKTAPNLRHGWRLEVVDLAGLRLALDYFYPARLAMLAAWKEEELKTTPLRETLDRQSGMYRVATNISDKQLDALLGDFCSSDGGCLRTIMWQRDVSGAVPSTKLPPEKFEPVYDQTGRGEEAIPLLCQEACNLLVNECRKMVKGE
jgi:sirohydrochlorin cobaltochelatase